MSDDAVICALVLAIERYATSDADFEEPIYARHGALELYSPTLAAKLLETYRYVDNSVADGLHSRHLASAMSAQRDSRLPLRNVLNGSLHRAFGWKAAMRKFAILYVDRFTLTRN